MPLGNREGGQGEGAASQETSRACRPVRAGVARASGNPLKGDGPLVCGSPRWTKRLRSFSRGDAETRRKGSSPVYGGSTAEGGEGGPSRHSPPPPRFARSPSPASQGRNSASPRLRVNPLFLCGMADDDGECARPLDHACARAAGVRRARRCRSSSVRRTSMRTICSSGLFSGHGLEGVDRARNPVAACGAGARGRCGAGGERRGVAGAVPQSARVARRDGRDVVRGIGRGGRALFRICRRRAGIAARFRDCRRAGVGGNSVRPVARRCGHAGAGARGRGDFEPRGRADRACADLRAESLRDERDGAVDDGLAEGPHADRSRLCRAADAGRHRASSHRRARAGCAHAGRGSRAESRHRCRLGARARRDRRGAGDGRGDRGRRRDQLRRPRRAASAAAVLRLPARAADPALGAWRRGAGHGCPTCWCAASIRASSSASAW